MNTFYMPTKIISGRGCVKQSAALFSDFGGHALIVCSKSAYRCGAFDDVAAALNQMSIKHSIFDSCTPNPSWDLVRALGKFARNCGCDFVIAIGGGSPMDSAKAACILAKNDIDPEALYAQSYPNGALPLIAIPTTAGTGSEVTPFAVLTVDGKTTKTSFGNIFSTPKIAFLDSSYTFSLPIHITRDTALDALCHAIEGYFAKNSGPISDFFALECFKIFGECYNELKSGEVSEASRDKIMLMAAYAGIVITQEKTSAPHAMGYAITCHKDIPHGNITAQLTPAFIELSEPHIKEKVKNLLDGLHLDSVSELYGCFDALLGNKINYTQAEVDRYTLESYELTATKNNPMQFDRSLVQKMYEMSLLR